jgi:ABC-type spermidine/putrescine transport system permease subunit I
MALVLHTSITGEAGFTASHYIELVSRPLYHRVMLTTLEISAAATVLTILIGYPIAYHLSGQTPRRRAALVVFVLLPFWTSILVKSFAFAVVLGTNGLVNTLLRDVLGIGGLKLLFNRPGVVIGMTHYLLPFMVFTVLASLLGQDPALKRAAAIMGARPWRIFWTVTLPLSLPGVVAGALLCLILSLGMFVTPALLGGRGDIMISNLVDFHVRQTLDWGVASALSVVLVAVTAVFTVLLARVRGAEFLEGRA